MKNKTKLKNYGITKRDIEQENFDLIKKIIDLLNDHNLWEPDDTYTFKDGERWAKFDPPKGLVKHSFRPEET